MEPSFTRPPDRHRLPAAVPLVSLARRSGAPVATAALAYFRSGSAARCSRLVDGSVGPFAEGRGFAISACDPSGTGTCDLRRHHLDAASNRRAGFGGRFVTVENYRLGSAGSYLAPALSRCAGGGPARGQDLQHLAGHRWRIDSVRRGTLLRHALVAKFLRKHANGSVRAPYGCVRTSGDCRPA